jgi:hypothetical protein
VEGSSSASDWRSKAVQRVPATAVEVIDQSCDCSRLQPRETRFCGAETKIPNGSLKSNRHSLKGKSIEPQAVVQVAKIGKRHIEYTAVAGRGCV